MQAEVALSILESSSLFLWAALCAAAPSLPAIAQRKAEPKKPQGRGPGFSPVDHNNSEFADTVSINVFKL